MSSIEQPCYTLINISSDHEMPNEMQLKADLGLYYNELVQLLTLYVHNC